jgi:hypothetical protein
MSRPTTELKNGVLTTNVEPYFGIQKLSSAVSSVADPGSGMNIPDHMSESSETIFWIKI